MGWIESAKVTEVSVTTTETSATLSLKTNNANYNAAEVVLNRAEDHSLLESKEVLGTIDNSVTFKNLHGLTEYEYTITLQGGSEPTSLSNTFLTTYSSQPLRMTTRDSLPLVGRCSICPHGSRKHRPLS